MIKENFFAPENEVAGSRMEVISPSGKYKLVISRFSTKPGAWHYSQGVVYQVGSDKPVATVQRNYGQFPHLFVEGPKGDFLVCGENYQGQTIVNLVTGQRRDQMSSGSDKGHGFCWASYNYNAPNQILVVNGCIWACPYEFRFYDFSDPMVGCQEIETDDCIYDDQKEPELDADGTMRCFQTRDPYDDELTDEENEKRAEEPPIVDAIRTYKRNGLKFEFISKWISDYEKKRRADNEEAKRKYDEWEANFKATDPLYLAYVELVKDPELSPDDYMSMGITYDSWGGDWKGQESRWCRRIIKHTGQTGPTVDLEWAVKTGPIKLVLFRDGKSAGNKFFEHSVDGMKLAFAYAKKFAKS